MRVVYLHQYFNTPAMPGGMRSYEIARRLVASGHEVHMVTSWRGAGANPSGPISEVAGIDVHWIPVQYANAMSYLRRLFAFVHFAWAAAIRAAKLDTDVIYATSTPLTIVIPAIVAARVQRIPFVLEVRDMWPDVPVALGVLRNSLVIAMARWLERLAYREAAHIVALAPGMRDDIIAKGVSPDKVSVVPNGCDLSLFSGMESKNDVRATHDWLGDRPLVIYAGAMGAANGPDYLARLAAVVADLDSDVRIVMFGTGRERSSVERIAKDNGTLGRTLFVNDPMAKRDLVAWLLAADMHVALMTGPRVYLKDAVNNKFFDALAAGKPIANNFHGWQTTIADEAGIGVYLDPKDLNAAACVLVDALREKAWLAEAGGRAAELARGRFNFDTLATQVEIVLRKAIES